MKRPLFGLMTLLGILSGWISSAQGGVVVEMVASPAPNVFGSPNFGDWFSNAQTGIRSSTSPVGSGPARYQDVTNDTRPVTEAIVTPFNSWSGSASPSPPFDNEFGQRMHFVYHIFDDMGGDVELQFIQDIELDFFFGVSGLFHTFTGDGSGVDFDATTEFDPLRRVGFDSIGNLVDSGNAAVKEIVGTFGLGFDTTGLMGTSQEQLDALILTLGLPPDNLQFMVGRLNYIDTSGTTPGSAQVNFQAIPEPATIVLWSLGTVLLGGIGWRRKRQAA